MLNTPDATARAAHKTAAAVVLLDEGLPVPRTVLALSRHHLNQIRDEFAEETVYKTAIGTHGGGTWKVGTDGTLAASVGNRRAFIQEFIGRPGETPRDLRVYIVGGQVIGAMYRYAPEGDWRTNVALGGRVEDATDAVPEEVLDLACRATSTLELEYAGVDLIEGDDGWYILEVNPTAGFKGFYQATGRSPAPYIAQLAIERAGDTVDPDRVEKLASTLDDSVPSCKPASAPVVSREPVTIGLIESVVVSGTSATKTVIAKSDSGAARTSIDLRLAAEIGTGPIHTVSRVRSASSNRSNTRAVVDLVVGIGGTQHTVAANIADRTHMSYPLLLGRDILKHYRLDVSRRVKDHGETVDEE